MNTICFVAGHSGGHIVPCLTLAAQRKEADASRILFIATNHPLDRTVIGRNTNIDKLVLLDIEQIPYKRPWRLPLFTYKFIRAVATAARLLRQEKVEQLITTGGFIAIPICLAATLLRIPIELIELNVVPGKTIKLLAPLAQTIKIIFPQTAQQLARKCTVIPYPVRFTQTSYNKEEWLTKLEFHPDKKTIFILGGSQGSQALTKIITHWITKNPQLHDHIQVIHQVGKANIVQEQINWYKKLAIPCFVFSYSDQLAPLYQLADLVITRAGSGTLAELQLFKTQTIIIPLETKLTDHQLYNAFALQELAPQQFTVLRQSDVEKNLQLLHAKIEPIFQTYAPPSDYSLATAQDQQESNAKL